MSLLETYQSRKNLIASNLTTMGVTASGDEGLTTLANKILQISPVGPVPDSIDLTGTKSILSFADSEQSVLTATVLDENDDPVEGVSVSIYKGTDLWYTANTDSNGEVSKTYDSAGVGDITFEARVAKGSTFLTKTYTVHDILKYIESEQTVTTADNNHGYFDKILDYTNPVKISAILKHTNGSGSFNSLIAISDCTGAKTTSDSGFNALTLGAYSSTIGLGYYSGSFGSFTSTNRVTHTQPTNTEYLVECEIDTNNKISSKITRLSDNTVLFSDSNRALPITVTGYYITILNRGQGSTKYREVKVEPL